MYIIKMNKNLIPVSLGELIDKITILEIKAERISDPAKLSNVKLELKQLNRTVMVDESLLENISEIRDQLRAVNCELWDIEDRIRIKESLGEFDKEFIELARSVYFRNDVRAAHKRAISLQQGGNIVEEKSYADYRRIED